MRLAIEKRGSQQMPFPLTYQGFAGFLAIFDFVRFETGPNCLETKHRKGFGLLSIRVDV